LTRNKNLKEKKHKKESDMLGYVLGTWIAGFHSTPPIQGFITLKKKKMREWGDNRCLMYLIPLCWYIADASQST
jgi:hypothetical protein